MARENGDLFRADRAHSLCENLLETPAVGNFRKAVEMGQLIEQLVLMDNAQVIADPHFDNGRGERLGDIIDRPEFQTVLFIENGVEGGDKNNRDIVGPVIILQVS